MMQVLEASISISQRDCVKINNKIKRHVLIYSS